MTQAEKAAVLSLRQQQYSFSAIAETTGLPLGTIKSFLSRASGKKAARSRRHVLQCIKPAAGSAALPWIKHSKERQKISVVTAVAWFIGIAILNPE